MVSDLPVLPSPLDAVSHLTTWLLPLLILKANFASLLTRLSLMQPLHLQVPLHSFSYPSLLCFVGKKSQSVLQSSCVLTLFLVCYFYDIYFVTVKIVIYYPTDNNYLIQDRAWHILDANENFE